MKIDKSQISVSDPCLEVGDVKVNDDRTIDISLKGHYSGAGETLGISVNLDEEAPEWCRNLV